MTENIKQLQAFLAELQGRREKYLGEGKQRIESLYRKDQKGRPPREFKETSFLYIRSYGADAGLRPLSDVVFWNSPDLQLQLTSGPETFTTELQAGSTYTIRCRLHNTGDVTVPYPKVQFYLCNPTLGFDTRFATHIGTTQYDGLLLPGMHDFVEFPYDVPPAEAGHRCLFARTYSFSPLDRPVDVYDLNPRIDRHIGQKNLHIVGQGSAYRFNIVHQPNMAERIDFLPMTRQAIAMLQLPMMEAMTLRGQKSENDFRKSRIEPAQKEGLRMTWDRSGLKLAASGKGPELKTQSALHKRVEAAMTAIGQGKASRSAYREVLGAFQDMNRAAVQSSVRMSIPDLGLAKNEVAGFELVNTNLATGKVKGGITLLVRG